ncbi:MAG: hypothetical protein HJJLKODD_00125 [Phycisphaerae bacterium]|nr:hypothetical protein [Phycisphaerae bacterium]
MAILIVTLQNGEEVRHNLTLQPQQIGRDPACPLMIDDPTVSRRHIELRGLPSGKFIVRDLGSKNGTLLNSKPITTAELEDGDEIMMGSVLCRFYLDEAITSPQTVQIEELTTLAPESVSVAAQNRKLQLSQKRLEMLYDISEQLTTLRDRQSLVSDIMKICLETFEFERAAIGLMQPDGRSINWPVVHNLKGPDGEIKISRTVIRQVLQDGQRFILTDSSRPTQPIDPTQSIVQQGTRSALCVPIAYSNQILGLIYGDRITTSRRYEQEDVDFLAALARQVSIGLTNIRLLEQQQQQLLLQSEIAIARQIQSTLFPELLDLHPQIKLAAWNEPGRQISGDYYDVIPLADGRIGMIVADVAGKGVASALLAANMQAAAHILFREAGELAAIAGKLNQLIYDNTDTAHFITALLGILDPTHRRVEFCSAGHPYPIYLPSDQPAHLLEWEHHLPLGIEQAYPYSTQCRELPPGRHSFLFFSDGLTEAMNEEEELYGWESALHLLQQLSDINPQNMIDQVLADIAIFCGSATQRDDITLLAAQLTIPAE